MDEKNYTDLLEALEWSLSTIIVAVVRDETLIDWAPAGDYYSLQDAYNDHDWPKDAQFLLLYGLDALVLYGNHDTLADLPLWKNLIPGGEHRTPA